MTRSIWAVSFALACAPIATGQPEREADTVSVGETGQRIVDFVRRAESAGFTGAVLAARGGEVVAAAAAGAADLDGDVPNSPATLFEIASATKQFTAAAVMRLVQDGKLGLDDPISKHLPGVPENCAAITVRHLLQHTSGIPGSNSQGAGKDLAKVLPLFLKGGPVHPPGTNWEYWNQGYSLLSEIIARASGKPYTAYCGEMFEKAGLRSTLFTGDPAPDEATVAVGRSGRGSPRSALQHPYGSYGFQYRGMGGVVTNVWDLWRWDRALRSDDPGAVLSAESRAAMFKPGLNDYAMGWFVRTASGRVVQSHGGAVRGFLCEVRRYPDDNGCLFVLSNSDEAPVAQVTAAVEDLLFGRPLSVPMPPSPLDAAAGKALAGRYRSERGVTLIVEPDARSVRARILWSASGGPVTRATVGTGSDGKLALFDWMTSTPMVKSVAADGTVAELGLEDMKLERVKE